MAVYYKKVDAIQFKLTEEEKERIHKGEPVYFETGLVKHIGGPNYIALLQQGENLIKILETQWLVRHPDGALQVLWPDKFSETFVEGSQMDSLNVPRPSFMDKTFNQPNILL